MESPLMSKVEIELCPVHLLYKHVPCQEKQKGLSEKFFKIFQYDMNSQGGELRNGKSRNGCKIATH